MKVRRTQISLIGLLQMLTCGCMAVWMLARFPARYFNHWVDYVIWLSIPIGGAIGSWFGNFWMGIFLGVMPAVILTLIAIGRFHLGV